MINTNSITNAIYTILSSDSTMVSSNIAVQLYSVDNGTPGRVPWVGIVPGDMGIVKEYDGMRMNINQPWMASITIPLVLQSGSREKKIGMQKLDELEAIVMSAINCADTGKRTLMGTVDIIKGFSVSPLDRGELEGLFFMRRFDILAEALT